MSSSQGDNPIDALDRVLKTAPPIPLTDWVRVDPDEVRPLVAAIQMSVTGPESSKLAEKLSRTVLADRPVPLTGQTRVHRRRAQKLLAGLRAENV